MTFEERQNLIGDLLRNKILVRKQRPERFDDATARAEIADMVDDLNRAWPVMPKDMFLSTGDSLARELRASHSGRDWPPIAVMLKALKAALDVPAPPDVAPAQWTSWMEVAAQHQLRAWLAGEGNGIPPQFITRERLQAIGARPDVIAGALAWSADMGNRGSSDPATMAMGT